MNICSSATNGAYDSRSREQDDLVTSAASDRFSGFQTISFVATVTNHCYSWILWDDWSSATNDNSRSHEQIATWQWHERREAIATCPASDRFSGFQTVSYVATVTNHCYWFRWDWWNMHGEIATLLAEFYSSFSKENFESWDCMTIRSRTTY